MVVASFFYIKTNLKMPSVHNNLHSDVWSILSKSSSKQAVMCSAKNSMNLHTGNLPQHIISLVLMVI